MVRRYGKNAIPNLRELAEIAVGIGDRLSVKAWNDIADAAAML